MVICQIDAAAMQFLKDHPMFEEAPLGARNRTDNLRAIAHVLFCLMDNCCAAKSPLKDPPWDCGTPFQNLPEWLSQAAKSRENSPEGPRALQLDAIAPVMCHLTARSSEDTRAHLLPKVVRAALEQAQLVFKAAHAHNIPLCPKSKLLPVIQSVLGYYYPT